MSKKTLVLVLALGMAFAAACKSEIDNKPAAAVSEPAAVEQETVEVEQALTQIAFEKEGSAIEFVGAKVTGDHPGGFTEWSGTASVDESGKLAGVNFEVDTASVYSDDEKLTKHLKDGDFFDVETYPKSTFASTAITENAVDGATHTVKGNLELRGVKKEIQFPATVSVADGKLVASSEFTIKRADFNIIYKGQADDLIKENVLMKLKLTAEMPKAGVIAAE